MNEGFKIQVATDPADPALISIVSESDEYLSALYPPESNHSEPIDALMRNGSVFFLGYLHQRLVACGAVRFVDRDECYAEIKRLFVIEEHRGQGFAIAMMQHLEHYAKVQGISLIRLEAGTMQPEALRLYRKMGYVYRAPFGPYSEDPLSVFMEKHLD